MRNSPRAPFRKDADLGGDVAGGIPWIEYTGVDSQKHIDLMFDLAKKYDVSMRIDDAGDPGILSRLQRRDRLGSPVES